MCNIFDIFAKNRHTDDEWLNYSAASGYSPISQNSESEEEYEGKRWQRVSRADRPRMVEIVEVEG